MRCYPFSAWNLLKKYSSHESFSSHSIGTKLLNTTSLSKRTMQLVWPRTKCETWYMIFSSLT